MTANDKFMVVRPATIGEAQLISCSIAETDYPEWAVGTLYAAGELVIVASAHRIYKSLVGANLGNVPASSGASWKDMGPTNRWRLFDQSSGSAASSPGSFEVVIKPGRADTVALVDVVANTVRVCQHLAGVLVYDQTITVTRRSAPTTSWFGYYFGAFDDPRTLLTFSNLVVDGTSQITVTIDAGTGVAECGELLAGRASEIGWSQYGASAGTLDFSRKTENPDTGQTTMVRRGFAKTMDVAVAVDADRVDAVKRRLDALRGLPILCMAVNPATYEALSIFGWLRDASVSIKYPSFSILTVKVEGLA